MRTAPHQSADLPVAGCALDCRLRGVFIRHLASIHTPIVKHFPQFVGDLRFDFREVILFTECFLNRTTARCRFRNTQAACNPQANRPRGFGSRGCCNAENASRWHPSCGRPWSAGTNCLHMLLGQGGKIISSSVGKNPCRSPLRAKGVGLGLPGQWTISGTPMPPS